MHGKEKRIIDIINGQKGYGCLCTKTYEMKIAQNENYFYKRDVG